MAKKNTPTYTIELPLHSSVWQQHRLEKKFKMARNVYNSCLGEALKRHKHVKADKEYRTLLREPKSKERDKQLLKIRLAYSFSEYDLHNFVKPIQHKFISPKANDEYAHLALMDKTKYVRILKSEVRGRVRFFVQLIQEGYPPTKRNHKIDNDESKRATNPQNYHENGTTKKSKKKWKYSNRYIKLRQERKELYRKIAVQRKQSHEKLANEILELGSDIRVETMRFQSLQKRVKKTTRNKLNGKFNHKKRFGKSIANHAPAMLLPIIDRKLGYQGRSIKKIDTYSTKASQFNHVTGEYIKKQLSERWNNVGKLRVQRDLYSAYLIGNTTETLTSIDVDLCNAEWNNFAKLHNCEIARLKQSSSKILRWFVA